MIMRVVLIIVLVALASCKNKVEPKSNDFFAVKNGVLEFNLDSLKTQISGVKLLSEKQKQDQLIELDSLKGIRSLKNYVRTPKNKSYLNTWLDFDYQGNFYQPTSNYYEAFIENVDDSLFINCYLPNPLLKGKCFISIGDYDNDFNLLNLGSQKIIYFNDSYVARIPIRSCKNGLNNMKFIIIETEKINDTLNNRYLYVNKDFWLL